MRPVALSDEIAVGEMPSADEIAILAKAGFRSILNVQPDGEVARLLPAAEVLRGATAAGLKYAHVPIATRRVPDDVVAVFSDAMVALPRPIYACCYSGARAAAAWALAVAPIMSPSDVTAACAVAGFDVSALAPDFARRHAGLAAAMATDPLAAAPPPAPPVATTAPAPVAAAAPGPTTAAAAITAAEKIIFPIAAGAGGFAVSG